MDWKKVLIGAGLAGAGAWTAGSYAYDVILRSWAAAMYCRALSRRLGKPFLNVGAGTRRSSFRAALLGPATYGDVNVDIAAETDHQGPGTVTHGSIYNLDFPDKHFGVALAAHVLEHLERPDDALRELERVADQVVIVTPRWWAPHTWLHPGHRWFISSTGGLFPLWGGANPEIAQEAEGGG
jgi:ubiquinone/menaquinone biosynthesis C-methylase UbiE